ncbi:MAG TPA: hypothetical protein VIT93_07285 [Dehalococcoidia bacterium]
MSLTVLILSLSACGGDDDDGSAGAGNDGGALSAESYFERFSEIATAAQGNVKALSDELSAEDSLDATADIFDEAADDADALNPPAAAKNTHGPFVDATHSLSDAFRDLAGASGSDGEASAGDDLDTALAIWSSRCLAVVAVGEALDVAVDVDCSIGP